jgi:hypothetical protein
LSSVKRSVSSESAEVPEYQHRRPPGEEVEGIDGELADGVD